MSIEVYCCHTGYKLEYINGWFGVVGIIMFREDVIESEEDDDRDYVKFAFCAWDSHLGAWYTLENSESFPADKLFEFQAAMNEASQWVLQVCKIHNGRFYYEGE